MTNCFPPGHSFALVNKLASMSSHLNSRVLLTLLLLVGPGGMLPRLSAGDVPSPAGAAGAADQELRQRESKLAAAAARIEEGRALAAEGKAAEALARFEEARRSLPDAAATQAVREEAALAFAETGTAEAKRLAGLARYDEARALVARVLDPAMSPLYRPARILRDQMGDPDRYPPAASPALALGVREVEAALREAESFHQLGRYDEATKAFNDVLLVDPYNVAARAGLEKAERAIIGSLESARNHTRARMLREVDEKWETSNPEAINRFASEAMGQAQTGAEIAARNRALALDRKMKSLMLRQVRLDGAALAESVDYLAGLARVADTEAKDPASRGISILLQLGEEGGELAKQALAREINLKLDNVPFRTVLDYVAQQAGLAVRVESYAVLLVPPGDADKFLFTRTYNVPPDFIASVPVDTAAAGGGGDPFAAAAAPAAGLSLKRLSPKDFLLQAGISFPPNAFAVFDARSSTLTMRNTSGNHDLLEGMVDKARSTLTPQVSIEARMVEVSENNMKELGFDWLVGAFSMANGVYGSGGGSDLTSGGLLPAIDPATGNPVGSYSVTSGNRSGDTATTGATLDRLLSVQNVGDLTGGTLRAPAALAIAGVLTEPNFQVLMRALSQKKGRAFLSAPTVITRSGLPARMEVIREFIYPTEYDPPELPNSVGYTGGNDWNDPIPLPGEQPQNNLGFPVTPATPTAFEMRPVGTILEAEPVISPDGSVIELNFDLAHVEFSGFVNYGSPITQPMVDALGRPSRITVTENRIFQPVFELRHLKSSISVYDGQTLVIGGFTSDNRATVKDKVPLLGDIPLLGRFFKSNVESSDRRILLFMMTVTSLDPSGSPIRRSAPPVAVGAE